MFVRKTTTGTAKSGNTYHTYRLCQNLREGGTVRQKFLLNLGTYFNISQEYWRPLCTRVKVLLSRQTEMGFAPSLPIQVEATAQWIVESYRRRQGKGKRRHSRSQTPIGPPRPYRLPHGRCRACKPLGYQ